MIYSISTVRGRTNYAAELSIKFEWFTSTCLVFFPYQPGTVFRQASVRLNQIFNKRFVLVSVCNL